MDTDVLDNFEKHVMERLLLLLAFFALEAAHGVLAEELAGVSVSLADYEGPARVSARSLGRYEVAIDIDPATERNPMTLRVELPKTGPDAWPFLDVEVLDDSGQPVSVRRGGIEWHKLLIPVPAARRALVVHAVAPQRPPAPSLPEKTRHASDSVTGARATIANWLYGRRAAMSLRFDDSHPTHLSKAIPLLRKYGLRGTFMVNPGESDGRSPNPRWRSPFQEHRAQWEAVARRGDQELANHTSHHRGARNDEEMEHEIGDASKAIWELSPGKSKLLALNLGGGTQWETTKTLRYYLDKYHLFASSGSLGMDDVYGDRVAALRRHLEGHVERGLWCRVHFHSIGEDLSISEAHFRAALDVVREHQDDLWVAGMADIYKYQTERRGASLAMEDQGPGRLILKLSCSTDPELYDQPLTIEISLPESPPDKLVSIRNARDEVIPTRKERTQGRLTLRFEVPPNSAVYAVRLGP